MKKKTLLIAICALLIIAALIILPSALRGYTVNKADKATELSVPAPFALYSGKDIGFSFLYPEDCRAGWEDDSACIYYGDGKLLVSRTDKKGMSPEKYFKSCDKLMLSTFQTVESTPIQEVPVGGKTLYLTRYKVGTGNGTMIIDRYLELYRSFYLQYTAMSPEAGALNTPVYYAIDTLRVSDGAYRGAFSEETELHRNEEAGISLRLPVMLTTEELTVGFISRGENCVLLAVFCDRDDNGNAIYNRQDFIDRAAENPDFVAGYLGAESAVFSEGRETTLAGRSFYCYPMTMNAGGSEFSGQVCLANADETGVYLLCYGVRDGSPAAEELTELCQTSLESISFD